ncbi:hypothetical protein BD311DRAFT_778069 [Dichomitus squalens]|uniref:Uncharacterized protein n=1 Tax=Dichomitus squalens TaxID=114155 RepID=A0A4Q9MML8_9APHY|nr:hypothetical protein BD311DRAFT_778069 [Dichomitus squalens]
MPNQDIIKLTLNPVDKFFTHDEPDPATNTKEEGGAVGRRQESGRATRIDLRSGSRTAGGSFQERALMSRLRCLARYQLLIACNPHHSQATLSTAPTLRPQPRRQRFAELAPLAPDYDLRRAALLVVSPRHSPSTSSLLPPSTWL